MATIRCQMLANALDDISQQPMKAEASGRLLEGPLQPSPFLSSSVRF